MSELKAIRSGEIYNIIEYEDCYRIDDLYYPKSEVDAAIAELKAEINRKEAVGQRWFDRCMEARAEYVKLKRALWLARAERAKEMCKMLLIQGFDPKWEEVERKCRAKAKEYK